MRKILLIFLSLFITTQSVAGIITQNIVNGCNIENLIVDDNQVKIYTRWTPNSYTCNPGYFLPANGIECVLCSSDHICPGGTYTFNESVSQGIKTNHVLTTDFTGGCVIDLFENRVKKYAKWTINKYICNPGDYLPADGIECELCPANSYCDGGTYTYSPDTVQGITGCTTGYRINNNECVPSTIDITWDTGDGSETTTSCTYNGDIVLPTPPEKRGYTFTGWKLITQ